MPGAISPATGLVKNANSTWLNGRPLQVDLERRLGAAGPPGERCELPGRLRSHRWRSRRRAGGVWRDPRHRRRRRASRSTGASSRAPTPIAGEWGHNPLPWPDDDERPGAACYCGRRGCIETFLSGPGARRGLPARAPAVDVRAEEVVARARPGETLRRARVLDTWTATAGARAGHGHQRRSIPT